MRADHLAWVLRDRVARYGDRTALRYRQGEDWRDLSWRSFGEQVEALARGLVELGVPTGGRVAIFSQNMPEWTIADFGTLTAAAVSVPIYPTNTAAQAGYILADAEARVAFVGAYDQYEKIRSAASPDLPVVVFEPSVRLDGDPHAMHFADLLDRGRRSARGEEVEARLAAAGADDLLTLIYTSGTTGEPKGVMLTHANVLEARRIHDLRLLDPNDGDVSLCFLPLSHVFERCWTYYALAKGMTNCYLEDPTKVVEALQQVRPTIMCAVPRFYEKVYAAILTRLQSAPALRRAIFRWATGVGRQYAWRVKDTLPVPTLLRLRHAVADRLVLAKLRAIVGGRIKFFPCAGAPLAREIEEFFYAAGIFVCYGYGLTETTATVSCHEARHFVFGSVGRPMPGVEVRIGDDGEIQVRGKTVMRGYYRKPEATAEAFVDGWFRTGDAGYLDDRGCLVITDRIKDLIKTSGGKYIAPQLIEARVGSDPLVEQIAVIGDERRFVSALIVPAFPALEDHARARGIPFASRAELIASPQVLALYQERLDAHNRDLARFEQIRKFTLLPAEFTVAGGEITPTLKVKRRQIGEKYRREIDAMYAASV
ncbi:MAG: AMP-dependent synthetase/ligase [Acidobacteriota bacterium]